MDYIAFLEAQISRKAWNAYHYTEQQVVLSTTCYRIYYMSGGIHALREHKQLWLKFLDHTAHQKFTEGMTTWVREGASQLAYARLSLAGLIIPSDVPYYNCRIGCTTCMQAYERRDPRLITDQWIRDHIPAAQTHAYGWDYRTNTTRREQQQEQMIATMAAVSTFPTPTRTIASWTFPEGHRVTLPHHTMTMVLEHHGPIHHEPDTAIDPWSDDTSDLSSTISDDWELEEWNSNQQETR